MMNKLLRFTILGLVLCTWVLGVAEKSAHQKTDAPTSATSAAAPILPTPEGLRRVSPHGVVAPTTADTTETNTVDYYNPNTGTSSEYELEVDRDSSGAVERINFPNGGWKEIDGETTANGDGSETYTDENGAEYTVRRDTAAQSSDPTNSDGDDGSSGASDANR